MHASTSQVKLSRAIVGWLLFLFMLHVPLPCFDLDGEDRGVPIQGFCDRHAWHVLLLGVAPASDIDRGPFQDRPQDDGGSESPFERNLAVSSLSVVSRACLDTSNFIRMAHDWFCATSPILNPLPAHKLSTAVASSQFVQSRGDLSPLAVMQV